MEKAKLINLAEIPTGFCLAEIGGKAAGLAVINGLSLPCPKTWVVTTDIFAAFKEKNLDLLTGSELNEEVLFSHAADFIAAKIGDDLDELPRMNYAVRSSATVEDAAAQSFAGMFESMLNVPPDQIPMAISRVWLSGLGERVRAYCGDLAGLSGESAGQSADLAGQSPGPVGLNGNPANWPNMAVVLQPMVDAAYAGVCFSRHPAPQDVRDADRALVEIVPGVGDQLVQGAVTPLPFVGTFTELPACLDRPWMQDLSVAVTKLEQSVGGPVDVEFAVDKEDRLWVLQQRPVTVINDCDILRLTGYRKAYKRTLCSLDIEFLIDGCARYLAPYLELAVDLTRWMVMTTNENDGQQELWVQEQLDDAVIRGIMERSQSDQGYLERLACRYDRQHRQILGWRGMAWADENLPLQDRLRDFFEFVVPLNAHYYAPMHIIEALSQLLQEEMKKISPDTAGEDFFALTTGRVITLGQIFARRCRELKEQMGGDLPAGYGDLPAHWQAAVNELAVEYGFLNCHMPYEAPYDSEEVYGFVKDTSVEHGQDENKSLIENKILALERRYTLIPACAGLLTVLREWLDRRNQQMEYLYYVYAHARPLLQAVGAKAGLDIEEVWNADRTGLLQALTSGYSGEREQEAEKYNHRTLCLYHDARKVCFRDDVRPVYAAPSADGGQVLKGKTVFGSGQKEGIVRIAFSPEEIVTAENGEESLIVVTGMTTPDFVPALTKKAAALITDEGGILCHAAIIAREIRLPCIVGAGVATEKLRDGTRVVLDLDRGEIRHFSYHTGEL